MRGAQHVAAATALTRSPWKSAREQPACRPCGLGRGNEGWFRGGGGGTRVDASEVAVPPLRGGGGGGAGVGDGMQVEVEVEV